MNRNMMATVRDHANYIRYHWGDRYFIVVPTNGDGNWFAVARFGRRDELSADTAINLLDKIRRHYGPKTFGYPFKPAA